MGNGRWSGQYHDLLTKTDAGNTRVQTAGAFLHDGVRAWLGVHVRSVGGDEQRAQVVVIVTNPVDDVPFRRWAFHHDNGRSHAHPRHVGLGRGVERKTTDSSTGTTEIALNGRLGKTVMKRKQEKDR